MKRVTHHLITLLAAIALGAPSARGQSATIPVADHHAHLKSPAVANLWFVRFPEVPLPPGLDRVMKDFARYWHARDEEAFASLFTENGVMQYGDAWRRGRASIRISQLDSKGADIRFWAQQFEMHDSMAYIIGSYGHRTLANLADLGRLHWSLRKGSDGVWRIVAAMMGNVNPTSPSDTSTRWAAALVADLDSTGMRRAAVMSLGYQFGSPMFEVENEHAKVREENDWTAKEVARFPDRLVAFCSVNPVRDYAQEEVERCMRTPGFTGLKMHFTSSFVDLRNADHVARLQRVFRTANARRFPIVVHMRTLDKTYGKRDAEIFLRDVIAQAPDVPLQIAHLAGWGGWNPETEQALGVFADAIAAGDARTKNIIFDLTVIAPIGSDSLRQVILTNLRRIGMSRFVYGIDLGESAAQMRERWKLFTELGFTQAELRTIAGNVAPYMRR